MKGALKMKQRIFVLGLLMTCLLGLTACGSEVQYNTVEGSRYIPEIFTNESITSNVNGYVDFYKEQFKRGVTPETFEENCYTMIALDMAEFQVLQRLKFDNDKYDALYSGYDSFYKAVDDIGYNSPDSIAQDITVTDVVYYINDDDELVVDATLSGTKHTALMEMYFDQAFQPSDVGVTINKTTGEKLENAGLNTLLGMGMAFAILILISLIISLFPVLFGGKKKKKESDVEIAQKAIENTVTQIADKEDLSNDAELVAVIAAAIAAYEGSASTDGFRVRSIRKVNRNWKNNR